MTSREMLTADQQTNEMEDTKKQEMSLKKTNGVRLKKEENIRQG